MDYFVFTYIYALYLYVYGYFISQSSSLAVMTIRAIVFELDIDPNPLNPYGAGKLLGTSAPFIDGQMITNRLLNYITFEE